MPSECTGQHDVTLNDRFAESQNTPHRSSKHIFLPQAGSAEPQAVRCVSFVLNHLLRVFKYFSISPTGKFCPVSDDLPCCRTNLAFHAGPAGCCLHCWCHVCSWKAETDPTSPASPCQISESRMAALSRTVEEDEGLCCLKEMPKSTTCKPPQTGPFLILRWGN